MKEMGYLALIAILCALVFLIRLVMMRRQLQEMITQLKQYDAGESDMKLALSLTDTLLENLTGEINGVIDREIEAKASQIRVEKELKEAISGMSHDLRTPLTAIIGYMQLLEKDNLTDTEREEYLAIAMQRATRLQQLIQNFFSLSVVEADDYPLQIKKIELSAIIKDLLLAYYDQFQEMDEQPEIHIQPEKVFVPADPIACKRVIENVLLNAIQHAQGGIVISLNVDEEKQEAVFSIQNSLAHQNIHADQLFNKFYTGDQTRKYSGGLGLSIVKSLMDKMNGTVDVQVSEATFEVSCRWKLVVD